MKTDIKKIFLLLILLNCIFSFSCAKKLEKKELSIKTENGNVITLSCEMAISQQDQMKGFMNRKNIPQGTGMLFVFSTDRIARFWMKNTPTALSIAYIDYSGKIRDIFDMTPYSLSEVVSTGYVRYALEVPQGWFEKVGIKKGDFLVLDF